MPSAQIKSAVLLAGLGAPGATTVIESEATRDHTERLLTHFGAEVTVEPHGAHGRKITLKGEPELVPAPVVVPADPSSAAFPMVAALIVPGSEVILDRRDDQSAAHRPDHHAARDGRRHRDAERARRRRRGRWPTCACARRRSQASTCRPSARPSMIDEYPILAVAAAFAEGTTRMRGLKELRVKESDRLAAVADGLRGQWRRGRDRGRRPDRPRQGPRARAAALVATHMDHRIAMAFLVMGLASEQAGAASTTWRSSRRAFPASCR